MSEHFHVPDHIRSIPPYLGGKPIDEVAREFGLDPAKIVKLASNENPLGVPDSAKRAMAAAMSEIGRYPDDAGFDLKRALAAKLGVDENWIVLGAGSSDILDTAAMTFAGSAGRVGAFAVRLRRLRARGPQGRRRGRRRAGDAGPRPRPRRDARGRAVRAAGIAGLRREPEQSDRHVHRRPDARGVRRGDAARDDRRARRGIHRIPASRISATTRRVWVRALPEPDRVAHVQQGVRTRRPAHRLRHRAAGRDEPDEPRPQRIQRQRARAGRRGRRARRRRVPRRKLPRQPCRLRPARRARSTRPASSTSRRRATSSCSRAGDAPDAGARVNVALLRRGVIVRPVANYGLPQWLRVSIGTEAENAAFLAALPDAMRADAADPVEVAEAADATRAAA